jgi:hypothetical protein
VKVMGREPVLWLALVEIAVKAFCALVLHVSPDQQAVVNAFVVAAAGALVAVSTHDGVSGAILGLVQAVLALGVGFGLHWSADQQAMVMSLASALVGAFVRTQVTAPVPSTALPRPVGASRLG